MSAAELSGIVSTAGKKKKPKRHPWDWYVEQAWVTHRLCDFLELETDVTYFDPCCGLGNIPGALLERGLKAFGADLFQRTDAAFFLGEHDFLGPQRHLIETEGPLSVFFNPPFSFQDGQLVRGLAERFVRQALAMATHKVAALLPVKWLASGGRYRLFSEHRPAGIYILCERPSMPPGDAIAALGRHAFARGKVDYMWVVWDKRAEPLLHAPTFWIPPRPKSLATPQLALAIAA